MKYGEFLNRYSAPPRKCRPVSMVASSVEPEPQTEILLSDAGLAALDDGVSTLESLLSGLADVPTPAGLTPLQLRETAPIQIEAAD
jgi:hypothetical protein